MGKVINFRRTVTRRQSIKQPIGATMLFTGGAEPFSIRVRVIQSSYHRANTGDKTLVLSPMYGAELEISAETMKSIIAWSTEEQDPDLTFRCEECLKDITDSIMGLSNNRILCDDCMKKEEKPE